MGHGEGLNFGQRERRASLNGRNAPDRAGETALAIRNVASVEGRHPMVVLLAPEETPRADPHAGCCGGWGRKTPAIRLAFAPLQINTSRSIFILPPVSVSPISTLQLD